jgi:hypothetical protein
LINSGKTSERKMDQSNEKKSEDFKFTVKTTDSTALTLQQLLNLRGEVAALAVIVIEELSDATGRDVADIAARYEEARKECALRLGFALQERGAELPDPPD